MSRILVAMSGGVDSSYTAVKLHLEGHEVRGVFMSLTNNGNEGGCCSPAAREEARKIANYYGFDFDAVDFKDQFKNLEKYFINSYSKGETPNPCTECNTKLKFGDMIALADQYGYEYFATGHYANVKNNHLYRGKDRLKDQSYMLGNIRRKVLSRVCLPTGNLTKSEVRSKAYEMGLAVYNKADSQDLCFIKDNYRNLLANYGELTSGYFKDLDGNIIGEHTGYQNFTRGQRKGIQVKVNKPHYVYSINPKTADVIVTPNIEDLKQTEFFLQEFNWLTKPVRSLRCEVQTRYHSKVTSCMLTGNKVVLENPTMVSPGQLAVFYQGDLVIGSGYIRG